MKGSVPLLREEVIESEAEMLLAEFSHEPKQQRILQAPQSTPSMVR